MISLLPLFTISANKKRFVHRLHTAVHIIREINVLMFLVFLVISWTLSGHHLLAHQCYHAYQKGPAYRVVRSSIFAVFTIWSRLPVWSWSPHQFISIGNKTLLCNSRQLLVEKYCCGGNSTLYISIVEATPRCVNIYIDSDLSPPSCK